MSDGLRNSRILSVARHVPDKIVTNNDLAGLMETSDEWIQQRTGIKQRHFSEGDTGAADLGAIAATEALRQAGIRGDQIGCVIFCTLSPDYDMPSSACVLQARMGLSGMPAFDVRNQCSGFIYALATADAYVKNGTCDYVLVVGGEIHSTGIDLTTRGREVGVIFGDGAGAVVIGPAPDRTRGILSCHLHAEGRFAEMLWLESPGSREHPRLTEQMIIDARIFPKMKGREVFRHAVTRFPEVIREALDANGLSVNDIDVLIPHQANQRISQMVAMGLELPEEKLITNIERYGNTTAASIPIALSEAIEAGKVRDGSLVCLAAFGAGFTWASALIRW